MCLDRALAEEERRGHLAVGTTLGDEGGDPPLGRGQALLAPASPDPPQLGTGTAPPPAGTALLEERNRFLDRLAGRALPSHSPPEGADCEQRAGATQRVSDRLVLPDRLLEQREPPLHVASRGRHQPAAAQRLREHPLAPEAHAVRFPAIERRRRIVETAEREQRLHVVGPP